MKTLKDLLIFFSCYADLPRVMHKSNAYRSSQPSKVANHKNTLVDFILKKIKLFSVSSIVILNP